MATQYVDMNHNPTEKTMIVFVVMVEGWDVVDTMGVFSTLEKAEKFVASLDEEDRTNADITPYEVV